MNAVQQIQTILGVTPDGKWGPRSQAALELVKAQSLGQSTPPAASPLPTPQTPTDDRVDDHSEAAIATLHRRVQPVARQFVKLAWQNGITIKITSGTRTYAEQDALFNKGNVTKARGGHSNHNFGLAFDVTMFDGSKPIWESPRYKTLGQLGKLLGLTWGGDWQNFVDEPHYQLEPEWANGMSEKAMLAELRKRHDNGTDVFA